MGTRTARLLATSALALALACSDKGPTTPPLASQFYYPTGLAVRHEPVGCTGGSAGCQTQLLVVSSNFDLRFDPAIGGTVIAVDVGKAIAGYDPAQSPQPLVPISAGGAQLGVADVGSFGGELAILDEGSCPGWQTSLGQAPQALVASRSQNALYRVNIGSTGLGLAETVALDGTFGDPYGVTIACGTFNGLARQLAFVTYLRTPNSEGELLQIDLAPGAGDARINIDLGLNVGGSIALAHSAIFDAPSTRLYVTERFGQNSFSPLRWFSLGATESSPSSVDLFSQIRGAEIRGMAISSDRTRGYLAVRIYDADTAAATGVRPTGDVAGALAVMDLTAGPNGQPAATLLRLVPIDRGASEIRVVPRLDPTTLQQRTVGGKPLRDLVAVTCTDDNTVVLYDDDTGVVSRVFDICTTTESAPVPCALGDPLTGKQPFGLAVELLANTGNARLYVGSFDRSWVNVIEIDPLNPAAGPVQGPTPGNTDAAGQTGPAGWVRIGPERP